LGTRAALGDERQQVRDEALARLGGGLGLGDGREDPAVRRRPVLGRAPRLVLARVPLLDHLPRVPPDGPDAGAQVDLTRTHVASPSVDNLVV
jgi:hypothetical protein